jgi:oligoendopeptidase F
MPATTVRARKEIAVEHTWDTGSVFPSTEDWEAAVRQVVEQIPVLARFQGRLGEDATVLAEWFDTSEPVLQLLGRILTYGNMGHVVDIADQRAAALNDRARALFARVQGAMAFARPEMVAIGFETLRRWAREEPRLAQYEHYFEELERLQAHVRSAEVEELLSLVADPFRAATATHGILADADLTFEPARGEDGEAVEIAQGNINALLSHSDRELRRSAWENYADAHLAYKNTMANVIATGVKQRVFLARARGYDSALEAALSPNHIPTTVFYNLIETFRNNLPIWHRYWGIRQRALGYETLYPYDVKAPLARRVPDVPYEQAIEWIVEGMKPLGEEYVSAVRRGAWEERWVDIYPNRGKRAGAFSSGAPGTHPFILMNYNDDMFGMSTLAHEFGHSMHSYLSWQNQPLVYARYSIFVAEVASNFNQAMVRAHLLDTNDDPEFQIAVIEEAMSNFHRYFFIMPTLARFELELHEREERGEGLTADSMIALMASLFREAFGEEVEVPEERAGITWAEFPTHMYLNFYVYMYATGIAGANALADRVLSGEPGAAEDYLSFLKAGGSLYPLDALNLAGVDLTTPEPVQRAFTVLATMVDRLEQLIGNRS